MKIETLIKYEIPALKKRLKYYLKNNNIKTWKNIYNSVPFTELWYKIDYQSIIINDDKFIIWIYSINEKTFNF